MTTTNNTIRATVLKLAATRKNGVTVKEATKYIQDRFTSNTGLEIPSSSVRARTYELEKDGQLQVALDDVGNVQKRNGAMVFKAL